MKYLLTAILICSSVGSTCYAQADSASRSHADAAAELLEVFEAEKLLHDTIDLMLKVEMEQNPMLAQFEDILRAFFAKHMAWQTLQPEYVRLYMEAFTEDELRELIAFYQTETGKKSVSLMPQLMQQGATLGRRQVQDNQHELEQMILERMEQLTNSDEESDSTAALVSEAQSNQYNVVRNAEVLHPDGGSTGRLSFNTQGDVEDFFAQVSEDLGDYDKQGNERVWKHVEVEAWSKQPVRLVIEASETRGLEETWLMVWVSTETISGEDLLIAETESHQAIKAYLQEVVNKTLGAQ